MKHFRKGICLILVVMMLASLTSAFATDPKDYTYSCYSGYKTYMCVGDSIAAGYTVTGIQNDPNALGFTRVPGAYHDLVANALEADLLQLGCSAFRSVELRYILDGVYTDTDGIWNATFSQAFTLPTLDAYRPYFINAFKAADIVTINLGSNDVLSYSYIRALIKLYEDTTSDGQKAAMEKIAEYGGDAGAAFVSMLGTMQKLGKLPAVLAEFTTAFNESFNQYKENWNACLKAIYELNPDIQIITVGVYNPASNISISEGGSFKLAPFLQLFVNQINQFLKSGHDYADKCPFADVEGTETWPVSVSNPDFVARFTYCSHPTRAGHMYMAAKIMEVIPSRYAEDAEPTESPDPSENPDPSDGPNPSENPDPSDDPNPSENPDPSDDPNPSENPDPSDDPNPSENPDPSDDPNPSENPDPSDDPNPSDEPAFPFEDVKDSDWFYDHVKYCYDNGLMNGKTATKFDPKANTTRAEFATVLWRLAGEQAPTGSCPFTDCQNHWAKDAITWAYENGVVTGVSDTAFDPNANVTREQMVAMLYRYMHNPAVSGDLSAFKDAGSVSAYAVDAFTWAVENGIVTGRTADTLAPKGQASRAELATVLHRFNEMLNA